MASPVEIGIIAVAGIVVLKIVSRVVRGTLGVGLFKIVGVAAILAGVALFWTRSERHEVLVNGAHSIAVKAPFWDRDPSDWVDVDWDFQPAVAQELRLATAPKVWMVLSGTVLIIVGALLFGRERTRPVAFKAFTWLGLAAVVFSLVSFFGTPPRYMAHRDRVVKLDRDKIDTRAESAKPAPPRATQSKRVARAKRPTSRPERNSEANDTVEPLPPRAGEIPVAAELAKTDAPAATPEPAAVPAPPTPVPAPAAVPPEAASATAVVAAPPAEPPKPVEPAKSVEAAAPVEKTKPVEAVTPPKTSDTIVPAETSGTRPAWVDAEPKLAESVYAMPVSSGLFVSVPECQRELDHEIKLATDRYIDEYLGEHASSLVDIPLEYLKAHVKKAEYGELVPSSVGSMHQIHARLEFDDNARADFHRLWHNAVVTDRLWVVGSGAALVLALLSVFYGFLKLDLRTGGAQTGRLQLAATLVALIVAAGALLMRWAVPF